MLRHAPLWLDRHPKSKRPSYPHWRGDVETRVVVVGGGLTGCACAYALVQAGVPVILLEADRVGAGSTAAGLGLVRGDFAGSFEAAARAHGVRTARTLWQGTRRASLDFAAALRRLAIRCDLEPATLLRVARTDPRGLRKELDARRAVGLEPTWKTPAATWRDTALESGGAISGPAFTCDPYRAALGLAAAAVARQARIFERSPVTRIRDRRTSIEVTTEGGTIHAEAAIIATSARLADLRSLRRHLTPFHRYAVVTDPLLASVRTEVGPRKAFIEDDAEPRHVVGWMRGGRALIAGGDQPAVAPRAQPQALVQRTGQLMYELSLLYPAISGTMPGWSWTQPYDVTVDDLPYLGPHRNFPRHFFALGDTRHGPSIAWLASRLALRWVAGRADKEDDAFGFSRIL
ncbi:MAG: FAD-binding oxidoreductase [Vicinamibacterales bacterium]